MVELDWGGSLPLLLGWSSYLREDGFPTVDVKFNTQFAILPLWFFCWFFLFVCFLRVLDVGFAALRVGVGGWDRDPLKRGSCGILRNQVNSRHLGSFDFPRDPGEGEAEPGCSDWSEEGNRGVGKMDFALLQPWSSGGSGFDDTLPSWLDSGHKQAVRSDQGSASDPERSVQVPASQRAFHWLSSCPPPLR